MADSKKCDHGKEDIYRHDPYKRGVRDREQNRPPPEQDAKDMTNADWQDYVDGKMGREKRERK